MNKKRIFRPIALVFILLTGLIFTLHSFLTVNGFDTDLLIYANILLFIVTLLGFILQKRGLRSDNPNAFVRAVYGSAMLKMFLCMIAVLIYIFIFRNKINKAGLFAGMGMYIIYTVVEVTTLMKAARNRNV